MKKLPNLEVYEKYLNSCYLDELKREFERWEQEREEIHLHNTAKHCAEELPALDEILALIADKITLKYEKAKDSV